MLMGKSSITSGRNEYISNLTSPNCYMNTLIKPSCWEAGNVLDIHIYICQA